MDCIHRYDSPLGGITLASDGGALTGLRFDGGRYSASAPARPCGEADLPIFGEACRWLDLYFSGKAPDFSPKLAPRGTAFSRIVWDILLTVPYGETVTYGEIAGRVAEAARVPRMSAQAVGGAVSRNPIALIIPCHRVVGAGGRLTGYAGGTERKALLLDLENPAGDRRNRIK